VRYELREYDWGSGDDNLGYLIFSPDHQEGSFKYLVPNEEQASVYELEVKISS
jgi:hypothetical protein